jgi:hypothetical protein
VYRHHHGKHNRCANRATNQKWIVVLIHAPPQKAHRVDARRRIEIQSLFLMRQEFQRTWCGGFTRMRTAGFFVRNSKRKSRMINSKQNCIDSLSEGLSRTANWRRIRAEPVHVGYRVA